VKIWLDAQLSPALCPWLEAEFEVEAVAVRDLDLLNAEDPEIFMAARKGADVVMTKDRDFVELLARLGPPPKIIWITAGNTSNRNLKGILQATFRDALAALESGESFVEIQPVS
jgi:predicted nuclease of predicted toxin-antitoxin system